MRMMFDFDRQKRRKQKILMKLFNLLIEFRFIIY
jgi:hypothetical protein